MAHLDRREITSTIIIVKQYAEFRSKFHLIFIVPSPKRNPVGLYLITDVISPRYWRYLLLLSPARLRLFRGNVLSILLIGTAYGK